MKATNFVRCVSPFVCQYPSRELQARLDGFGPAVAEERPLEAGEGRETCGQLALQRVEKQIRRVYQRRRLGSERAGQRRMRVAERGDANARDEVEITAPVVVVQPHALAPLEDDGKPAVDLQHVLRFKGANVTC